MDAGVALREALVQRTHEIGIGARHQLIEQFDDRDFAAERVEHAGHLQADDAAADDEQFARDVGKIERVGRIHHARVVPREVRQLHRLRARRDDRLLEADELLAVLRLRPRSRAATTNVPVPVTTRHLALLGHAGEAADHLRDDLVLERAQLARSIFGAPNVDAVIASRARPRRSRAPHAAAPSTECSRR